MASPALPTVEQVNAVMRASIPLTESCNIELVALEPGYAKTRCPIEGNGNHIGTMYAGVLFSVAEVLGGVMAAVTFDMSKYAPLVKSMNIDFRKPGRSEVFAEARLDSQTVAAATAAADADGRGPYELHATVTDPEGVVIATTVGQYQLRPHR